LGNSISPPFSFGSLNFESFRRNQAAIRAIIPFAGGVIVVTESLLSFSEVLLFGRVLEDLEVSSRNDDLPSAKVGSTADIGALSGVAVNGQNVAAGDIILLIEQANKHQNGLYTVGDNAGGNLWENRQTIPKKAFVQVEKGDQKGFWRQLKKLSSGEQEFRKLPRKRGLGKNKQLDDQLGDDAQFARIYGFSYEGTYYELPEPTVFLVHGDGESASAASGAMARSPLDPSTSGVASAEYQMADGIMVWSYDKADYSIRMDVMTGMLEQVLLDIYFGFDSPAISGAKVSGAKVSGAKVSGAKVSGAKVSGAKVSGAKARGSGD